MDQNNKNAKLALHILRVIETLYLVISFLIIIFNNPQSASFEAFLGQWVYISYFLLPVLLFKNIIVAVYNKGILTQKQKTFLVIRCVLYVLLSFLMYPLVVAL